MARSWIKGYRDKRGRHIKGHYRVTPGRTVQRRIYNPGSVPELTNRIRRKALADNAASIRSVGRIKQQKKRGKKARRQSQRRRRKALRRG